MSLAPLSAMPADPEPESAPSDTLHPADRCLEVATISSDTLRAGIRVSGDLEPTNAGLLTGIVRTHLTAGRRYLRVDLADAGVADPAVVEVLVQNHRAVSALGGMLIFERATPAVVDAIHSSCLFVRPAED